MATLSALNKCIQQNIRSSAKLQQTQLTFDISNNFLAYQKGLSSFFTKILYGNIDRYCVDHILVNVT